MTDLSRMLATIENYGFECEAGPLTNCGEWRYLKELCSGPAGSLEPGYCIGWQPIETAPKDGTLVDLVFRGPIRITDCKWSEGEWWQTEQYESYVCVSNGPAQPTHWSRPTLPRAEGGGK